MYKMKLVILIILLLYKSVLSKENCHQLVSICNEQSNCRDCIRAHFCCEWCYAKNVEERRCITKNDISKSCPSNFLEKNYKTSSKTIKAVNFTDVEDDVGTAIQFKPQEYNVLLRYGESINISISYRPAKNHPLDLYYLMDLTRSMKSDLQTLTTLGKNLANLLKNLTQNYRIAFGSYIDKPEMPFYQTDPLNKENPCRIQSESCERGYVFKHRLNFTQDMDTFIAQVKNSGVSANADDPEGGADAMMQIALCEEQLGWYAKSRKLILMATEGTLHFAGDGLLAGYTKRDVDKCYVDSEGNYMSTENNDYPSLEEVHHKLNKKKINVIVAAKSTVNSYYRRIAELINGVMFVAELEKDSINILTLVRQGYEAFLKKVNLFVSSNLSKIPGLNVDFYADCNADGNWKKTHLCMDAKQGHEMNFKIQFSLNEYQTKNSEVIYIEERNIHEKIKINLKFVDSICKCDALTTSDEQNKCVHGILNCGECLCVDGWSGVNCSQECTNTISKCRYMDDDGIVSQTCSGRGECICSKCVCISEQFQGRFCEFECPINKVTKQVCSGHGTCVNSTCICEDNYSGAACSCKESQESCIIPGTNNICSNSGSCECDQCVCSDGFSGRFCEKCGNCNDLCDLYKPFVVNNETHQNVEIEQVEQLSLDKQTCFHQYTIENSKNCIIYFHYTLKMDTIKIIKTKETCSIVRGASFFIGIIAAAFLVLLALIVIIWKGKNAYLDRIEYQKFLQNKLQSKTSEINPLYKDPIVIYHRPQ